MKTSRIATMAVYLLCMVGSTVLTSEAATSFNGSTIIGIDQTQRTITFRTKEGQSWTLPVGDPDLLKKERISVGDQVSIEIDLNDRITKVLKPSNQSRTAQTESRDEASQ